LMGYDVASGLSLMINNRRPHGATLTCSGLPNRPLLKGLLVAFNKP